HRVGQRGPQGGPDALLGCRSNLLAVSESLALGGGAVRPHFAQLSVLDVISANIVETWTFIQATAQEGRAWARLGDRVSTRDALHRAARLASALDPPEHPEHHYQYDPAKHLSYTATTLSWIADPAADGVAREVVARIQSPPDGRPRQPR